MAPSAWNIQRPSEHGEIFEKSPVTDFKKGPFFSRLLEGHAFPVTSWPLKTEYTVLQARNPRE